MRKRMFGLLAALALCLVLLPGTALAEGDPGVSINSTPLESGKQYVAGEYVVIEKPADAPADTPYLDYRDGVLTVHGQMDLKSSPFTINGAVTFTGGGDSCLETANIYINGTLTLSGSMDFKPKSLNGNSSASPATKLTTTDDYSGDIAIQKTSTSVLLDVQSSASISIGGNVSYFSPDPPADPITLKSAGDISTDLLQYHTITIEGKNVSLMNSPVFTGNSLTIKAAENVTVPDCVVLFLSGSNSTEAVSVDISAGGNVEITSSAVLMYDPPNGRNDSLTIRDAKSVSIQGITNDNNPSLFRAPVTFENCGSVTVTATGTGEILKEGVPVTSDCPWTATAGGKTVTMPSGTWEYGGEISEAQGSADIHAADPTVWKVGEGRVFYEPAAAEGGTSVLTLDNAAYDGMLFISSDETHIVAKGENRISHIDSPDAVTVDESGGTLNAVVSVGAEGSADITAYGKTELPYDLSLIMLGENAYQLTVQPGAELTIPDYDDQVSELIIADLTRFTNHGTVVNEGGVTLRETAAENVTSETIKGLGLTGTGTVTVEKTVNGSQVTETYTNSGLKLLDPAGTLDLSADADGDADHWEDQGYKWEVLETDPDNTSTITKAKLTLAPGFNAETVVLPDAAVEIVSGGECTIGTLTPPETSPGSAHADKTNLTLSGEGPLTVRETISISGGNHNTLTVARDAVVVAAGGVSVGSSGSVDGLVTVNGTLIAAGGGGTALSSGNVVVGGSGTLKVSGTTGVSLAGKTGPDFHGALTIQPGGRLEADCTGNAVEVTTGSAVTFDDYEAGDILVFPSGYVPQGHEPRFNEGKTTVFIPGGKSFSIDSTNVPTPPPPSHRHAWAEDWTISDTHHWHNCTASGCPVTADSGKDGYGEHVYSGSWDETCNVCGYTRTLPSPEPSGGSDDRDDRDSGDSAAGSYAVTVERTGHGNIRSSHARASAGSTVTLTAIPDSGYALDTLSVTDSRGDAVRLTEKSGKHTFIMPGRAVTVRAVFAPLPEGGKIPCDGGAECPSQAFADLKGPGAWYHEAVDFVLERGWMGGYGNGLFGPDNTLTRGQFTQILYNQAGRPAVTGKGSPFTDVAPDAWCAPAVAWAAERGVAGGYGGGLFGPDDPVTREQLAVMLWRRAGSPAAPDGELTFADAEQIGAHAREALRWAVRTGVMNGKTGGVLDPKGPATRAQAAQMLKNFLENG